MFAISIQPRPLALASWTKSGGSNIMMWSHHPRPVIWRNHRAPSTLLTSFIECPQPLSSCCKIHWLPSIALHLGLYKTARAREREGGGAPRCFSLHPSSMATATLLLSRADKPASPLLVLLRSIKKKNKERSMVSFPGPPLLVSCGRAPAPAPGAASKTPCLLCGEKSKRGRRVIIDATRGRSRLVGRGPCRRGCRVVRRERPVYSREMSRPKALDLSQSMMTRRRLRAASWVSLECHRQAEESEEGHSLLKHMLR